MIETGTFLQNRYRLESRVGQGGMGAVFLARDVRFGSRVAVKQTLFDDPTLRKAFEREAHLLNRLRHGALPKVSDHFVEGDGQFLVMEFIEGSDLGELLEERGAPFPPADVLRWGDELLDALEYLHTQEPPVVHRDIKPQNLKLTEPGRKIVLLDFGLAKGNAAHTRATSNATGSVFGYSRNYAALEQIQGAGTDPRSDLYSLAATLYHLLTGAAPADALTRASAAVNNQPDPLLPAHRVRAGVPAQVGLALQRALALKAAARPHTAAEMRAALRQAAQSLPAEAVHQAHASGSYAQGKQDLSELTLIETETAKSGTGQSQSAVVRETTQVRGVAASRWDVSEATVVDRASGAARQPSFSYAPSQTDEAQPAGGSRTKVLGLALAALALLAVVGYTLTQRSLAQLEDAPARTQAAPDDPSDAQTSASQPTTPSATQSTLPAAYDPSTTAQPSRYDGSGQQNSAQPAQGNAAGANAAGTGAGASLGGGSEESTSSSSDIGASSGGGGLTIHRPAPSPLPNEDNGSESGRRAEEPRPAPPAEQQRYAPVEQRPAPPPPYGGQPPPPRHGGPPPPGRRQPGH